MLGCMKQLTNPVDHQTVPAATAEPSSSPTPSELLENRGFGSTSIGPHLWGFQGLHGGLALALATIAMSDHDGPRLRSVTGQFLRTIRNELDISTQALHRGRSMQVMNAVVRTGAKPAIHATATFSSDAQENHRPLVPPFAVSGKPLDYDVFTPPAEFLPISRYTEIRPVGPSRPYAGGDEPVLRAWIRLADDDTPIDGPRLIMLADALAPSYSAIHTDLVMVPTIELTVRPGDGLRQSSSPWALLQARTTSATTDGWINEEIDLWSPDGGHLGSAHQLRLVVGS